MTAYPDVQSRAAMACSTENVPVHVYDEAVAIVASYMAMYDGRPVVTDENGAPRQRPDPLGSGAMIDVTPEELIRELRTNSVHPAFIWNMPTNYRKPRSIPAHLRPRNAA